jgi:hypothetical protein
MKTRRLVSLLALLAVMMTVSLSVTAEEKGGIGGVLTSTNIGGYVDTSATWHVPPTPDTAQHECRGWWQRLFHRLGFHRRR